MAQALLEDIQKVPGLGYPTAAVSFGAALRLPEFTGWILWPASEAAAALAVASGTGDNFDDSLALLAELTPRLTSESAIRHLLRHNLDSTLAAALAWTTLPDEHVRRLASEGTRPYLPWVVRVPGLGCTIPACMPWSCRSTARSTGARSSWCRGPAKVKTGD